MFEQFIGRVKQVIEGEYVPQLFNWASQEEYFEMLNTTVLATLNHRTREEEENFQVPQSFQLLLDRILLRRYLLSSRFQDFESFTAQNGIQIPPNLANLLKNWSDEQNSYENQMHLISGLADIRCNDCLFDGIIGDIRIRFLEHRPFVTVAVTFSDSGRHQSLIRPALTFPITSRTQVNHRSEIFQSGQNIHMSFIRAAEDIQSDMSLWDATGRPSWYELILLDKTIRNGEIPLDGQSAGAAIGWLICVIRNQIALHAEILSLWGVYDRISRKFMPVEGLKEKLFACKEDGIRVIAVPETTLNTHIEGTPFKDYAQRQGMHIIDFPDTMWISEVYGYILAQCQQLNLVAEVGRETEIRNRMERLSERHLRNIEEIGNIKYNESLYVERPEQNAFQAFLSTDRRGLLYVGPSGVGKTNILCRLFKDACSDGHYALFINARLLEHTDLSRFLHENLLEAGENPLGFDEISKWCHDKGKNFIIFIDAINEYGGEGGPFGLLEKVDDLVSQDDFIPKAQFVLTCRNETWKLFLENQFISEQHYFSSHGDGAVPMGYFEDEVLREKLYQSYQDYYQLRPERYNQLHKDVQELTKDPFRMRIIAETYSNRIEPVAGNENSKNERRSLLKIARGGNSFALYQKLLARKFELLEQELKGVYPSPRSECHRAVLLFSKLILEKTSRFLGSQANVDTDQETTDSLLYDELVNSEEFEPYVRPLKAGSRGLSLLDYLVDVGLFTKTTKHQTDDFGISTTQNSYSFFHDRLAEFCLLNQSSRSKPSSPPNRRLILLMGQTQWIETGESLEQNPVTVYLLCGSTHFGKRLPSLPHLCPLEEDTEKNSPTKELEINTPVVDNIGNNVSCRLPTV